MAYGKIAGMFAPPTGFAGNMSLGAGSNPFGYRNNPLSIGSDSIGLGFVPIDFSNIKFNSMFPMNMPFAWTPTLGTQTFGTNTSNFINTPLTFDRQPIQYNTPVFTTNNISLGSVDTFERTTTPAPIKNLTIDNYNSEKGNKLARYMTKHITGFNHRCAGAVSDGLEHTGLSNGMRGNGCDYYRILKNNPNFKEISLSSVDYRNLPEGCILTYDKGKSGYSSDYGHVEVSLGDGTAASDGLTHNIRKPSHIFMPV